MKLKQLMQGISFECISNTDDLNIDIQDICFDSRKAQAGLLFVCLVGYRVDGHQYIEDVINKGCKVVVISKALDAYNPNICYLKVADTRQALALMSANFFGHPAKKFTTIAVTGTKGKTSITGFLKGLIQTNVGTIGTLGTYINDSYEPTINTTPESYEIQRILAKMVDANCHYCILEASSQGLKHHRLDGIQFDYGIFTNLSNDHIGPGEHPDFEDYLKSKALLFQHCNIGILNKDDPHYKQLKEQSTCNIYTYGCGDDCDLSFENLKTIKEANHLGVQFKTKGLLEDTFKMYMPGRFNVYNILPCLLLCHLEAIDFKNIHQNLKKLHVPGRLELYDVGRDFSVMIDFAHNGISTTSVLDIMQEYHFNQIYCVYGSVGDRSQVRRYEIGEAVSSYQNTFSIITADNPGYESLRSINKEIIRGVEAHQGKYIEIDDRKEAILYALNHAKAKDLVLILGKGNEFYQLINGIKEPFNELEILESFKNEKS